MVLIVVGALASAAGVIVLKARKKEDARAEGSAPAAAALWRAQVAASRSDELAAHGVDGEAPPAGSASLEPVSSGSPDEVWRRRFQEQEQRIQGLAALLEDSEASLKAERTARSSAEARFAGAAAMAAKATAELSREKKDRQVVEDFVESLKREKEALERKVVESEQADAKLALTTNNIHRWKDSLMIISGVTSAADLVDDLKDLITDMDYEIEVEIKGVDELQRLQEQQQHKRPLLPSDRGVAGPVSLQVFDDSEGGAPQPKLAMSNPGFLSSLAGSAAAASAADSEMPTLQKVATPPVVRSARASFQKENVNTPPRAGLMPAAGSVYAMLEKAMSYAAAAGPAAASPPALGASPPQQPTVVDGDVVFTAGTAKAGGAAPHVAGGKVRKALATTSGLNASTPVEAALSSLSLAGSEPGQAALASR